MEDKQHTHESTGEEEENIYSHNAHNQRMKSQSSDQDYKTTVKSTVNHGGKRTITVEDLINLRLKKSHSPQNKNAVSLKTIYPMLK